MAEYQVPLAQKMFAAQELALRQQGILLDEGHQAALFAKCLVSQTSRSGAATVFCADNEMFIAKNPVGYAITGYYLENGKRSPFSLTVCKQENLWYPARNYVAADTKSGSSFILMWILLCAGCTMMGILMYFIISKAVGL